VCGILKDAERQRQNMLLNFLGTEINAEVRCLLHVIAGPQDRERTYSARSG
jgi:hypothetical protein